MHDIPTYNYLSHALQLSTKEMFLRASLMEWLPDTIIDCHAHANASPHVIELDAGVRSHVMSTFPDFDLKASEEVRSIFYPGKTVRMLRFAFPYRGIDHRKANEYLLQESPDRDRVALYGIPTDIEYTVNMLRGCHVAALKMYYYFFNPPAKEIYEFFPPAILEEAQSTSTPIILHLPVPLLGCVEQLEKLLKDFPRLIVVLAHMGLYKQSASGLLECYQHFAQYPTIYADTAMVPSSEVVDAGLKTFGVERIMYGSDEPLSFIRSTPYNHPVLGRRIATTYPYHWVNREEQEEFGHLAANEVHAHWQTLEAIRVAINNLPVTQRDTAKFKLFYENARGIYSFV